MVTATAFVLDYIGTLVEPRNYSMYRSMLKLHNALCQQGLVTNLEGFLEAYSESHERHRIIRYKEFREVTNAIWVAEALSCLGPKVTPDDLRLKCALNIFFKDFLNSLKIRPHAKRLIKTARMFGKVGLVSNFTYSPAIYSSLRMHRIDSLFNVTIISDTIGWRKPHKIIFDEVLRILQVKPEEAVFIGDSPLEDIAGAKKAGIRTIFVPSRFNKLEDLQKSCVHPDFVFGDLAEVCKKLPQIARSL